MSKELAVALVDSRFTESGGELVATGDGDFYNAMLNQTVIASNANKFYLLQLVQASGKIYLFTCYGRIGEKGKSSSQAQSSLSAGKSSFEKQFKTKSGNSWLGRKDFQDKKGKYHFSKVDCSEFKVETKVEDPVSGAGKEEKKEIKKLESKLDARIQNLISLISNVKFMDAALARLEIDAKKMPLGKISAEQVGKARTVLQEIRNLTVGAKPSPIPAKKAKGRKKKEEKEEKVVPEIDSELIDTLSSKFYTFIPLVFGRRKPPIIEEEEMLGKYSELLDELEQLVVAVSVSAPAESGNLTHPLDTTYQQLKTEIKALEKGSEVWNYVNTYIHNTTSRSHGVRPQLMEVFSIKREDEHKGVDMKDFSSLGNRQLLWHGSRITNFCSIIQKGLVLNPESLGVVISGKMFGYGTYFADAFSKSFQYTDYSSTDNIGALLLCEVALGKVLELKNANSGLNRREVMAKGYDSVRGMGNKVPNPKAAITMGDVMMPAGRLMRSEDGGCLQFNEFIVYDTRQISIKYLVLVKNE